MVGRPVNEPLVTILRGVIGPRREMAGIQRATGKAEFKAGVADDQMVVVARHPGKLGDLVAAFARGIIL